jgi:hypothetical protein
MGFDVEVDLLISTETWTSVYLLTQLWLEWRLESSSAMWEKFTSRTQGLRFSSSKMSKPSISKHTLSVPGIWPGRHILYVWNKYGSATSNVFKMIS